MKNNKKTLIISFILTLVVGLTNMPSAVLAVDEVSFTADTDIQLGNGIILKVMAGGVCDQMVVGTDSVTFTLSSNSSIDLRSYDRYVMNTSLYVNSLDCNHGSYSRMVLIGQTPTIDVIITPILSVCPTQSTGGGAYIPPVTPTPTPTPTSTTVKPEDYGLKEGDLIRAEGDFDIFIINQYGYKRLFLNPTIFNMYGHLNGGWSAVKTVTTATRDAFITSTHYRFVNEDKVYHMKVTGEDTGTLHWINMTAENFLSQGGKSDAIFTINKSEFDWYGKEADVTSLE